jgi:hypothetical protein
MNKEKTEICMKRIEKSMKQGDFMELTSAESIMLEVFRRVPESQQKIVIQLIRDELKN